LDTVDAADRDALRIAVAFIAGSLIDGKDALSQKDGLRRAGRLAVTAGGTGIGIDAHCHLYISLS
jgi:hypothetical protein